MSSSKVAPEPITPDAEEEEDEQVEDEQAEEDAEEGDAEEADAEEADAEEADVADEAAEDVATEAEDAEVVPEEPTKPEEPSATTQHPFYIYFLTTTATWSGLLFGYNLAIINGAMHAIKAEYELESSEIEYMVSSLVAAAAVFALLSGAIADAVGRKISIMAAAIVFIIGGALLAFANGFVMLLVGRITVGAAIGVVSSVVPVYISECAPSDIRGRLLTFNQLFITLGIFLSAIMAGTLQSVKFGWRIMFGLSILPGIAQFGTFFLLPESPRYLVMKGKIELAEKSLKKIRRKDDVSEERNEIVLTCQNEKGGKVWEVVQGIFTTRHVRYALFIGCMLQVFQQLCGINSVIYYSSNILKSAGFDVRLAIWLNVIPFGVNFFATFLGIWAVESLGRSNVLTGSYLAIAVALGTLVVAFLPAYLDPIGTHKSFEKNATGKCLEYNDCWTCTQDGDCAFCAVKISQLSLMESTCVPAAEGSLGDLYARSGRCAKSSDGGYAAGDNMIYSHGYCPSSYGGLAIVGLIFYVLGFAPGAGPMPWTINAEIYPIWCRSVANSLATMTNWVANFIVGFFFLTVTKIVTSWGTFLGFSVICIISAIFTFCFLPETKDLSLEDVEMLFMRPEDKEEFLAKKAALAAEQTAPLEPDITQAGGDAPSEDVDKSKGEGEGDEGAEEPKDEEGAEEPEGEEGAEEPEGEEGAEEPEGEEGGAGDEPAE